MLWTVLFLLLPTSQQKSLTWDSVILTWDAVKDASFYQIEADGSKSIMTSDENTVFERRLLPNTEHSFRVRAVRGNSARKWSDAVKEKTLKKSFKTGGWEECFNYGFGSPGYDSYIVHLDNPKIAHISFPVYGIKWNIVLPPNKNNCMGNKIA